MNRIYQGKVTQVEIPDPDTKGKWLLFHRDLDSARDLTKQIPELREKVQPQIEERARLSKEERNKRAKSEDLQKHERFRSEQGEQWQTNLWKHHELFQDAVNYYFAVFAAMVPDKCTHKYWREYRDVIERCNWRNYSGRKGTWLNPFAACMPSHRAERRRAIREIQGNDFRNYRLACNGGSTVELMNGIIVKLRHGKMRRT